MPAAVSPATTVCVRGLAGFGGAGLLRALSGVGAGGAEISSGAGLVVGCAMKLFCGSALLRAANWLA